MFAVFRVHQGWLVGIYSFICFILFIFLVLLFFLIGHHCQQIYLCKDTVLGDWEEGERGENWDNCNSINKIFLKDTVKYFSLKYKAINIICVKYNTGLYN